MIVHEIPTSQISSAVGFSSTAPLTFTNQSKGEKHHLTVTMLYLNGSQGNEAGQH